jgi:hypothetical protein
MMSHTLPFIDAVARAQGGQPAGRLACTLAMLGHTTRIERSAPEITKAYLHMASALCGVDDPIGPPFG